MRLPLVSRGRLHREVAAAAEAYRWERDAALQRARRAERRLDQVLADLVYARADRSPENRYRLRIVIEAEPIFTGLSLQADEMQRLAERVLRGLAGLSRDPRGDLRRPPGLH